MLQVAFRLPNRSSADDTRPKSYHLYDAESFDGDDDLDQSDGSGLESSVIVGNTSFAKVKNKVDKKWLMENGMHRIS